MNFSIYTFANLCRTMYHLGVGCHLLGVILELMDQIFLDGTCA
jgi:hypothetical protein